MGIPSSGDSEYIPPPWLYSGRQYQQTCVPRSLSDKFGSVVIWQKSSISHFKWSWTFRSICSVERNLEHGRLSQNLIIRFYLNLPDSKMGKRVTY